MNNKQLDRVWLQIQNQKSDGFYEFLKYKHLVTLGLYGQQYFKLTASNGAEFLIFIHQSWGHVSDLVNYIEEQIEEQFKEDSDEYIFITLPPPRKNESVYDPNKDFMS
tara:strand:- start:672 stop:995 length:324 start_codon:yes stop_codon:yes gene_type:complete